MKNFLFIAAMLLSVLGVKAQNAQINPYQKNNEIKVDILQPLLSGSVEAVYERNFNSKSSLGVSGLYMFTEKID